MRNTNIGKSFTRRYYEDMLERFEAEAKFINSQKELDVRKQELAMKMKEAYELNVISLEHLQKYLKRIEQLKIERKQQFSIQELKYVASMSGIKTGDNGTVDSQSRIIDMSSEKELKTKSEKERG